MTTPYVSKAKLERMLIDSDRHLEACLRVLAAILGGELSIDVGETGELLITHDEMVAAPLAALRIGRATVRGKPGVRVWLAIEAEQRPAAQLRQRIERLEGELAPDGVDTGRIEMERNEHG